MLSHHEDFNEGMLGIDGRDHFVPGALLAMALLYFYNNAAEDEVGKDWGVENVKAVACELEKFSR